MGSLTIRKVDDSIKDGLRKRAAASGVSMEEEARRALRSWVRGGEPEFGLGTRLHRIFKESGGEEFEIPARRKIHPRPLPDILDDNEDE